MRVSMFFSIALAGIAALASTSARADLIGTGSNTIDPIFYLGDKIAADAEDEGTKTIANGLFYNFGALDDTSITVSGTKITLTNGSALPFCNSGLPCTDTFTGFEFTFSSGVDITGVTVDGLSAADFTPIALTLVSATDVLVNLTGLSPLVGDTLTIDFTFPTSGGGGPTPTPEPMSLALFGVGLAGLLIAKHRKPTSASRKLA